MALIDDNPAANKSLKTFLAANRERLAAGRGTPASTH
jgi:hypothetical protein